MMIIISYDTKVMSKSCPVDMLSENIWFLLSKSQLLLLGKFEYGGGPIFKVVLEC